MLIRFALWVFALTCLFLRAFPVDAVFDPGTVGALTPFTMPNSLDLARYCNGSDNSDDSSCMGTWINDAKIQGKHLYVSAGTYIYSRSRTLFNGVHLKCSSPEQVIFKNINNVGTFFAMSANFSVTGEPWQDISIENCGFDMNGTTANFASVVFISASTSTPARFITIRGNRVFDSTQLGSMYTARDRQRQYLVLLNVQDVLVEQNHFSEGGRIKVGRPGSRVVIRDNTLHNINDNGITVVTNRSNSSSDFLIERNTITNPLVAGFFFGTDGQEVGTPEVAFSDITIRRNSIVGDFASGCILGTLPNNALRVSITDNTCHKTGSSGDFVAGIMITRSNNSTLPARDITIKKNVIRTDIANTLSLGGIFFANNNANVCLIDNEIYNSSLAISMRGNTSGKLTGNQLNGGTLDLRAGVNMDQSGETAECFVPTFISSSPTPSPTVSEPCPYRKQGDANCDGIITLADSEQWRREFTREASTYYSDFNTDGSVNLSDFEMWRQSFLK
jgi:hypothetical protein